MSKYLLHRIGTSIVVLIGVSIVAFLLLHLMSPSPGRAVLGLGASQKAVNAFNHANGYDRPLIVQYFSYFGNLLQGNLGRSYKLNESVSELLAQNMARTAMLVGTSLCLAILIAIPLGIFQAYKRNTAADHILTTAAFITYSMPSFFLSLILIDIFSLKSGLLKAQASQSNSPWVVFTDPKAMTLPIVTLVLVSVAMYSRYQRTATLDVLVEDYVRVAKAKGLSDILVLARHVFRNACIPMVNLVGMSIPQLLAGNMVVESVFNYPGLGLLFFNSLQNEDYPVLLAYTLIASVLTVIGNLLGDVVTALADPRIEWQ